MRILYRPTDTPATVAADFIPFYWQGAYHLFYLKDYRDVPGHGEGTPWWQLVTRDFVAFEDWGEALPRGASGTQDVWVFTGSAIERQGVFHIFFVGHNQHFAGTERPVQVILHATSPDLRAWKKDEQFVFAAPTTDYEKDDWRDPYVFWNEEAGEYWMLLAARKKTGPSRHRGCVALASSPDLTTWTVREPFWTPDQYYTHECPDLFRIGEWWYLAYSTFSERCVTHYRMSRSLKGPWIAPANDSFDGRAYYAAKTAGDGAGRRYAFGWLPTRAGDKDSGDWQWGGDLVVHQIAQQPDGTLTVHAPESVLSPFSQDMPLAPRAEIGSWAATAHEVNADARGRFSALTLGSLPDECLLEATVTPELGTVACGLLLRADQTLDSYYQLRLEPPNQRVVVDRWPRPGDQPFMLERPLPMAATTSVRLRVLVSGSCLVAYADDQVALSCRMYDHPSGQWGLFVADGQAAFRDLALKTRS